MDELRRRSATARFLNIMTAREYIARDFERSGYFCVFGSNIATCRMDRSSGKSLADG